jgi:hypothetical protein
MLEQHKAGKVDYFDLSKAHVVVVEDDAGEIIEMGVVRMVQQFEPIMKIKKSNGKYASTAELRRATLILFNDLEAHVKASLVRTYIAFLPQAKWWDYARKKFLTHIYPRGRFYRKEL